jgi:biopolymer transport protein ExbB
VQGFSLFWSQADGVGRAVALLLLAMSVAAWVLIGWKQWVLRRAARDIERGLAAFWSAPTFDEGRSRLAGLDREQLLLPLLDAAAAPAASGTLEAGGALGTQLTRRLRDALHRGLAHLQFGQVLLASIGSTAPFVGLFGTVWGIYHALVGIAASGSLSLEKVSGPIGESLVMTAAGIAVAVPAVLGYNGFGKRIAAAEAELEGFAHDLRQSRLDAAAGNAEAAHAAP